MKSTTRKSVVLASLLLAAVSVAACSDDQGGPSTPAAGPASATAAPAPGGEPAAGSASVVGVWASADGGLRLELRPDGTFSEDYNGRVAAYTGRYQATDSTLTLNSTTGITATGTISAGAIQLSGQELRRQP